MRFGIIVSGGMCVAAATTLGLGLLHSEKASKQPLVDQVYQSKYGSQLVQDAIQLQKDYASEGRYISIQDAIANIELRPYHEDLARSGSHIPASAPTRT